MKRGTHAWTVERAGTTASIKIYSFKFIIIEILQCFVRNWYFFRIFEISFSRGSQLFNRLPCYISLIYLPRGRAGGCLIMFPRASMRGWLAPSPPGPRTGRGRCIASARAGSWKENSAENIGKSYLDTVMNWKRCQRTAGKRKTLLVKCQLSSALAATIFSPPPSPDWPPTTPRRSSSWVAFASEEISPPAKITVWLAGERERERGMRKRARWREREQSAKTESAASAINPFR